MEEDLLPHTTADMVSPTPAAGSPRRRSVRRRRRPRYSPPPPPDTIWPAVARPVRPSSHGDPRRDGGAWGSGLGVAGRGVAGRGGGEPEEAAALLGVGELRLLGVVWLGWVFCDAVLGLKVCVSRHVFIWALRCFRLGVHFLSFSLVMLLLSFEFFFFWLLHAGCWSGMSMQEH